MSIQEENAQTFGCETCWPESADAAWVAFDNYVILTRLVDESHYKISLRQCPACGQRFVYVFTETVDWIDGEDPQYRTVMPLTEQEAAELEDCTQHLEGMLQSLAPERRSLKIDFPKGDDMTKYWGRGIRIGSHD